ncbi:MAG: signal peptide peptidase SppA [Desulfohalobiaceae bacterium]
MGFSQKHPFLFGFFLIVMAVVLIMGAMAFFKLWLGDKTQSWGKTELGVVQLDGMITESRPLVDWIQQLENDDDVQGVVLRINSPGGLIAPAQEVHQAVKALSNKKPVVASVSTVAASGGYYVACAAEEIIANPGSMTGSIGVKAQVPNLQELMRKLGVEQQTIVSGKMKDAGSPTRELTAKEKEYFQNMVDELSSQFIQVVAQSRDLDLQQVRELADGRAFTGTQALDEGLVDQLGGMQDAVRSLRDKAQVKGAVHLREGPQEEKGLLSWILSAAGVQDLLQKGAGQGQGIFSY